MDFSNRRDRNYGIGLISSGWRAKGENVWVPMACSWSDRVVMPSQLLGDYLCFFQAVEDFTVEQLIA